MSTGLATQAGMFAKTGGSFAQASSITALWDFESGDRTADEVGTNDMIEQGTVTYGTGKIGDGVSGFSSSNYLLSTADPATTGTAARTYFGWFKTSTVSGIDCVFSHGEQSATPGESILLTIESTGAAGSFWVRTQSRTARFGSGYDDGAWHSYCVTMPATPDLSDVKVYIDGSEVTRDAITSDGALNTGTEFKVHIGRYHHPSVAYHYPFENGEVDQVGIADTEWSASDCAYFHNSGSGRSTADLLTP